MRAIKRKTYSNFILIMNRLQKEKGYSRSEAEKLTHQIFDNLEANAGRTAEQFYNMILSKADYIKEYGI